MTRTILLDSGPLGLITNPRASKEAAACGRWLVNAITGGATVMVPAIADYEVRCELIRARRTAGIGRLDAFIERVGLLPITTSAMRRAAAFWAEARQQGRPTAADAALDGDVILAAQASELGTARWVVLVGNKISPGNPVTKEDGTVVRTLWGELAWQLGGRKAFDRIAADDENATNAATRQAVHARREVRISPMRLDPSLSGAEWSGRI